VSNGFGSGSGPGADGNARRKSGIPRFIEILAGNFRELIKLNLLFCACVSVSVISFVLGIFGFFTGIALVLALVAAYPVGGGLSAYMFCITKMLRDEPLFIWHDFKRKLLENMKQAAAPGILCAAFLYVQIFLWNAAVAGVFNANPALLVMDVVFLLAFGMVAPYVFLQIAYIELRTGQILTNSIVLAFANTKRSIVGADGRGDLDSIPGFPARVSRGLAFAAAVRVLAIIAYVHDVGLAAGRQAVRHKRDAT